MFLPLWAGITLIVLSDGFSVERAKAGIAILRDSEQKDMIGTLYSCALHTPKGFWSRPQTAEI